MPKKGFKVISIREDIYPEIKELADMHNCSVAGFIEILLKSYKNSNDFQHALSRLIEQREKELERLRALLNRGKAGR
jgi:hypothetical protein